MCRRLYPTPPDPDYLQLDIASDSTSSFASLMDDEFEDDSDEFYEEDEDGNEVMRVKADEVVDESLKVCAY